MQRQLRMVVHIKTATEQVEFTICCTCMLQGSLKLFTYNALSLVTLTCTPLKVRTSTVQHAKTSALPRLAVTPGGTKATATSCMPMLVRLINTKTWIYVHVAALGALTLVLLSSNDSARSLVHHKNQYATLQSVFQKVTRTAAMYSVRSVYRGRISELQGQTTVLQMQYRTAQASHQQ